jgi:hypothetical protein
MSVSTALAELTTDKKGEPTMGPPMKARQAGMQRASGIPCGARRAAGQISSPL